MILVIVLFLVGCAGVGKLVNRASDRNNSCSGMRMVRVASGGRREPSRTRLRIREVSTTAPTSATRSSTEVAGPGELSLRIRVIG